MSTIAVDNARPSAGGTSYSLTDGVAKAWVNFNGTGTIAARDSYNVSGLTDNGTGDYTISFSNSMANVDYSCSTNGTFSSATAGTASITRSAGSNNVITSTISADNMKGTIRIDHEIVDELVIGDLA
mgnify:CR=1 FL=1